MRITVSIDDNLLKRARRRARSLGLTLGQFVESALRRELSHERATGARPEIPVFYEGTGLRAGVVATSTRTLLDSVDRDQLIERLR